MSGALIEAALWLLGLDEAGAPLLRFDATLRVDRGMAAQIGAWEGVSYGVEHLPRYRFRGGLALPLFVAAPTLADRFGGKAGRLTPGAPAHLAVFAPGVIADRAALRRGDPGVTAFVGGEPVAARDCGLAPTPGPAEAALWAAATNLRSV